MLKYEEFLKDLKRTSRDENFNSERTKCRLDIVEEKNRKPKDITIETIQNEHREKRLYRWILVICPDQWYALVICRITSNI